MPDVQSFGCGGGVRSAQRPVPAGRGRAAAHAAARRGRTRQLRRPSHVVPARRLPRARARDWPNQCGLLHVLPIFTV